MKRLLWIFLAAVLLVGCGPSKRDYQLLLEEKEQTRASHERLSFSLTQVIEENEALRSELDLLTSGPQKLYADLLAAMEMRDYRVAYQKGRLLLDRFGDTTEAIRARNSVGYAQNILAARSQEAKSRLRARHDYSTQTTWYTHRESDDQLAHTPLYLYIGQRGEELFLRMRVQRTATEHARWQGYEVKTAHESFRLGIEPKEIRTQKIHGGIWQWHDLLVGPKERRLIGAIIRSQQGSVAFFGDDAQQVRLTPAEVRQIGQMLEGFDALVAYPLEP